MSKVRLGDVAKEHKETCKGDKSDYPIVGLEHLEPECITLSQWSESTDNTFSKVFRKGHVLFGRRRAYLKKAAVAPFDGICSGDITVIEAIPGRIIPELLPFVIQNDALFDFAVGRSAGSLSPRVKWEHLKNYEFELPASEEEQRKLADVLWSIEQTRKSYNSLLRATDELVKSQFIELFGDPVENPFNWETQTIAQISENLDYKRVPIAKDKRTAGKYPYYGASGIVDYVDDYIFDEPLLLISEDGANLLARTSPIAFSVEGQVWVNNHAHVLRFSDIYSQKYVEVLLSMMDISCLISGSAQPKLNQEKLNSFSLAWPPLDTKKQYYILSQQLDKSKFELEQALSELTLTYKRILAENLG